MSTSIKITENKIKEIIAELTDNLEKALEECGLMAEKYAVLRCPTGEGKYVGTLRTSITHTVDVKKGEMAVGSPLEYAPYVELGTGQYYAGGRKTPWVYEDDEGKWHRTNGQKAQPYIKPAIADHTNVYINILKENLFK